MSTTRKQRSTKILNTRVPPEVYEQIAKLAKSQNTTVSDFLRDLLINYLKNPLTLSPQSPTKQMDLIEWHFIDPVSGEIRKLYEFIPPT